MRSTNPEQVITTTNGEEKRLKDITSCHQIKSKYERGEFVPLDFGESQPIEIIAICAQEGFEPGFVAKTAMQGIKADYIVPSRPQEYSIDISSVEEDAYEEKALRSFIEHSETADSQRAEYILRSLANPTYTGEAPREDTQTLPDYMMPKNDSIKNRLEAVMKANDNEIYKYVKWANALYDQPEARADGWTLQKIVLANRQLCWKKCIANKLEDSWPEPQRHTDIPSLEELQKPLIEIAETIIIEGMLEAPVTHRLYRNKVQAREREEYQDKLRGDFYGDRTPLNIEKFVQDSILYYEPRTESPTNPRKWEANPHILKEYETIRAEMMANPNTTIGELRDIVREWLKHEPRKDHGGSEGLHYSLKKQQAWYEARLKAIQNGTYAEEFAQAAVTGE